MYIDRNIDRCVPVWAEPPYGYVVCVSVVLDQSVPNKMFV